MVFSDVLLNCGIPFCSERSDPEGILSVDVDCKLISQSFDLSLLKDPQPESTADLDDSLLKRGDFRLLKDSLPKSNVDFDDSR